MTNEPPTARVSKILGQVGGSVLMSAPFVSAWR
jgi:hypothetical protein